MIGLFVELGAVAEFCNGAAFKPTDWEPTGRRIIRIQNLTDPLKPYNFTNREVPDRLLVRPGDLLVSWSASLGVFEWSGPDIAVLNQHIFRVVPDESRVEARYLRHGLEQALTDMRRHLHGATMQHVNRGEFLATKLYLPPLPEQRRIAAILDKVAELRAKRRAALTRLETLTQSIFLDMFGDQARNPKEWPIRAIGDVIESAAYGTSEKARASGKIPVIRMNNITASGETDFSDLKFMDLPAHKQDRFLVRNGDLLFNRTNSPELVGKTALFEDERRMAYAGYLIRLRPKGDSDPAFLVAAMNTPYAKMVLRRMCKSIIGMANINATEIKGMKLPWPPLPLQRAFAQRRRAIREARAIHRKALSKLDALFVSLQHRAFRGEL